MSITLRAPAALRFLVALVLLAGTLESRAAQPDRSLERPDNRPEARPLISAAAAIDALRSDDLEVRESAAKTLAIHAEEGDLAAIRALIGLLDAAPSKIRYHADWGLSRSGAHAVPALREAFARETDDDRRAKLARALGRIALDARAAEPELIAALADPHSVTARHAAYALGAMHSRDALPVLARAYATARKTRSQRDFASAIGAIGSAQTARRAREALLEALVGDLDNAGSEPALRNETIRYVAELLKAVQQSAPDYLPTREELAPLLPLLQRALDDPEADTLTIVRALGHAGGNAAAAVPALSALLEDSSLMREAERALASIATPAARRILAQHAMHAALEKRIRQDYSVYDHQGHMRLLPFDVFGRGADSVRMETRFLYNGEEPLRPTHVVVVFESYSAEPRFDAMTEVQWSADGEGIVMGEITRKLSQSQKGVIEYVSGVLPIDRFEVIASAKRVSAQLAALRIVLADQDRAALRLFAAKIPPPGSSAAAATR